MAERLSGYQPEEERRDDRDDISLEHEETRDLLLAWLEIILEKPKNSELLKRLKELEYNRQNGE